MEIKHIYNLDSYQSFLEFRNKMIDSSNGKVGGETIPGLHDMFKFIREEFEEFHHTEYLHVVLQHVHYCLRVWITRREYLNHDIEPLLVELIKNYCENDAEINIVVQIIYQVMHSIKILENDISITQKLLLKLIDIFPLIINRLTSSNWIACVHKYIEKFPDSVKNLESLWILLRDRIELNIKNDRLNEIDVDILIQFIDDFKTLQPYFHDETILVNTIQYLLKSDQRKFKKCGYYLLKKFIQYYIEFVNTFDSKWMSSDHSEQLERSWIMYVTILENLDEEQSHLILPSLENLEQLVKSNHLPLPWMKILYCRILTHNNNLVKRWSIEFFLKTFSCSDICEETLKDLLQATNCNSFFNCEGYFLDINNYSSFLEGGAEVLLRLFSQVENWKSVPLYNWLESIVKIPTPKSLTFEEILKISCCVRKLQNCAIREKAIEICKELFKDFIQKMSMKEYVTYIETIHNPGDKYLDHGVFFSKKSCLIQSEQIDCIYGQRFYQIFTNYNWINADLLSFLSDISVEKHGWLKFALFKYQLDESAVNLIRNLYKLDLNALKFLDIHKIIKIFKNCLMDYPVLDKHEVIECDQAAISFYIYQKNTFEVNEEDILRFILNTGITNNNVLDTFAEKLLNRKDLKIDLWLIDELLKYNSEKMLKCVSKYLLSFDDENLIKKYAVIILKISNFEFNLFDNINLLDYCTDVWFRKLASQGDKRIEEAFLSTNWGLNSSMIGYCLRQVKAHHDEQFVLSLIKYHTDITKKKPRYFENSNEHRVKLRIAVCIYTTASRYMSIDILDQLWNILINENNQLNITYIYEYVLGLNETREAVIIHKLKEVQNLTSSQQASVISVAYLYTKYNNSTHEMQNTMVYTLLSLAMGPNFQTRLLAQMSLYHFLKSDDNDEQRRILKFDALSPVFKSDCWDQIIKSIEDTAGTKLNEYLNEIRLNIYTVYSQLKIVLYVTNVPFDESVCNNELNVINADCVDEYRKLEICREFYLKKFKHTDKIYTTPKSLTNDQLQRKMNPVNDLTEPHNLVVYPIEENTTEMIVVATLIEKLPNLGGIARTCDVLGIKNLVMDSKTYTEKTDFQNLSMTAEKTLNILEVKAKDLKEFLMLKKLEGYIIVGAEQTCKSHNFENFVFPPKCVLLLGHEKEGIPAPLLGVLDEAVEIPQFGQVRSLNVHVTAALFMWEYCKQHLIPK